MFNGKHLIFALLIIAVIIEIVKQIFKARRLKLYCLDFYDGEYVQWVIARNQEQAIKIYCDTVGKEQYEDDMIQYFHDCPDDTIEDFYDNCISIEPDYKTFPEYDENEKLVDRLTVAELVKREGRPCYAGCSDC